PARVTRRRPVRSLRLQGEKGQRRPARDRPRSGLNGQLRVTAGRCLWRRYAPVTRALVLVLSFALAACATTTVTHDARLPEGQGVVLVRVVSNLESPEWREFYVKPESRGETARLWLISAGLRGSYVFAGTLPAGSYSPSEMFASHTIGTPQTG